MGSRSNKDWLERFLGRHQPEGTTLHDDAGMLWLNVPEPAVLANFFAYCKTSRRIRGRSVFLRGQGQRHRTILPSLFRSANSATERNRRWVAYRQFLQQLPTFLRGTRFTKRNFGAVLQHYGFRTPWLDVVDDLHAAIWFALNDFDKVGSKCVYRPTRREFGWIAVIDVPSAGHVLNLREAQSSRNTRCNVQQGYSLAMQYDDARVPSAEQDFMVNVICMVRIPNGARWRLLGFRGSSDYFFPPPEQDDTYRQLLDTKVATIAGATEKAHELRDEALGRVNTYH